MNGPVRDADRVLTERASVHASRAAWSDAAARGRRVGSRCSRRRTVDGAAAAAGMAILGRVTNRAAPVLRASALAGAIAARLRVRRPRSRRSRPTATTTPADGVPADHRAGSTCATSPSWCPPRASTGIVVGQAVNRSTSRGRRHLRRHGRAHPGRPSPSRPARARRSRTPRPASRSPASRSRPARWSQMTVTTDEAGANVVKVPVLRQPGLLRGPHRLVLRPRG